MGPLDNHADRQAVKALRLARHPLDCADDGQDDSGPASADAPGRAPVVAEGDGLQLRLASDSAIWVGVEEGSEAQVPVLETMR